MGVATKKKTVAGKKTAAPESDGLDAVDLSGGPALVERFRARAEALAEGGVKPLRASSRLMYVNAERGAANVLAEGARLRDELPAFDVAAARELPDLGLATAWAAEEVTRYSETNPADVRALLKKATGLRALLLSNLDGASKAGLVPAEVVRKIHEGGGAFDTAGDCVASAAAFRKYAAKLRGKTPVTAAQVKEAAETGAQLLKVLQPKGARAKGKAAALRAAIALRDRLATLLALGHADLRRAGGWLFGEERDAKVPLLLSNAGGPKGAKKKAAPAGDPAKPTG